LRALSAEEERDKAVLSRARAARDSTVRMFRFVAKMIAKEERIKNTTRMTRRVERR
jgi:hypothetical protein